MSLSCNTGLGSSGRNADAVQSQEVVLPHLSDGLSLARWLTGNAADAEDIVQDACIKSHAGIGGYAGGSACAWFLTIVRNASYTWMSRNRSRRIVAVGGLDELEDLGATHGTGTSEAASALPNLVAKAEAANIERAIAALPDPLR